MAGKGSKGRPAGAYPPAVYGACDEGGSVKVVHVAPPTTTDIADFPAVFPRARGRWGFHARRGLYLAIVGLAVVIVGAAVAVTRSAHKAHRAPATAGHRPLATTPQYFRGQYLTSTSTPLAPSTGQQQQQQQGTLPGNDQSKAGSTASSGSTAGPEQTEQSGASKITPDTGSTGPALTGPRKKNAPNTDDANPSIPDDPSKADPSDIVPSTASDRKSPSSTGFVDEDDDEEEEEAGPGLSSPGRTGTHEGHQERDAPAMPPTSNPSISPSTPPATSDVASHAHDEERGQWHMSKTHGQAGQGSASAPSQVDSSKPGTSTDQHWGTDIFDWRKYAGGPGFGGGGQQPQQPQQQQQGEQGRSSEGGEEVSQEWVQRKQKESAEQLAQEERERRKDAEHEAERAADEADRQRHKREDLEEALEETEYAAEHEHCRRKKAERAAERAEAELDRASRDRRRRKGRKGH